MTSIQFSMRDIWFAVVVVAAVLFVLNSCFIGFACDKNSCSFSVGCNSSETLTIPPEDGPVGIGAPLVPAGLQAETFRLPDI